MKADDSKWQQARLTQKKDAQKVCQSMRCQMLHISAKCRQFLQFFDSVGETFDSYA